MWDASGTRQTIPTIGVVYDFRRYLGRSGNSEIPDRLGFSQHMKTRAFNLNNISRYKFKTLLSRLLRCAKCFSASLFYGVSGADFVVNFFFQ